MEVIQQDGEPLVSGFSQLVGECVIGASARRRWMDVVVSRVVSGSRIGLLSNLP